MSPVQLRFDYESLDLETREYVLERKERIHNLARMTATSIVQIGQHLIEVKTRLKHGKFLEWIEREFGWKERSARAFMQVHEQFKSANFADLQIDVSALYLIAAPSTPEPVRAAILERAESGEAVTHAGVRALVERFADTGEVPEVQVTLGRLIADRRERMLDKQPAHEDAPEPIAAPTGKTAADPREAQRLRDNAARVAQVFEVIESIERLNRTALSISEIADAICRLDTPDQNWREQVEQVRDKLNALSAELNQ